MSAKAAAAASVNESLAFAVDAAGETGPNTRTETTEVQALPLTKSPLSRRRDVDYTGGTAAASAARSVDSGVGGGVKAYLPTFITSLFGNNKHRSQPIAKGLKSDCNYQLLAESEGLLSAFDEYKDQSGQEEDEEEEDTDLTPPGADTVINMQILTSKTHLVGAKSSRRKKLIWGAVIGAIVIAVIVVVVVLVTGKSDEEKEGNKDDKPRLELSELLSNQFSSNSFNGTFISDDEILFTNADGFLSLYNVNTKADTVLVNDAAVLGPAYGFWVSPNKEHILIAKNRAHTFRHSFQAQYDVMDVATKVITPIIVEGEQYPLQLAQWSTVGNGIVLVFNNNIFYKDSPSAVPRPITTDGGQAIINGIPDWVYEEEVFASNCALWFSPDGTKLAFARFDDTPVRGMSIPVYGTPGSMDSQYTQHLGILYPKAGSPNPMVTLHSVDLSAPTVTILSHPYVGPAEHAKPLLTAVNWLDNNRVVAAWMNRVQNECFWHSCTATACTLFSSLKSTTGWIEPITHPLINKDGNKMAIIESQPQEGGDSFKHLTLVSTTGTDSYEVLTQGKFVVTKLLKWDHVSDLIFYLANTEQNPEYQHLYVIRAVVGAKTACLSCQDVDEINKGYTYFSAAISAQDKNIVALSAEGPGIPMTTLYEVKWLSGDTTSRESKGTWESNAELDGRVQDIELPTVEKDTIDMGNGFSSKVKMLLPPGIDRSGNKKYGVLVEVYGGPDTNAVSDAWTVDFGTFMASQEDLIYVRIDGRGSGLRGDALMHQVYRKFGTAEIEDQTTTAKLLAEKYPFIDATRMAIWGWSYGGYAAGMALAKDTNSVWKCAASVAPVTDWTYYDSIYTERYMGLPSPLDNKLGYDNSRLSTMAQSFNNKSYLLIHGTLDDNVHYQQAMALSRSLEVSDVPFKQITYPDENHSLSGVRPHLYHSLTRYFSDCLEAKTA